MTTEGCLDYCASKGFPYAGTEYSVECYCGSSLAAGSNKVADSDCNMACSGNPSEPCGAGGKLSLFHSSAITGPAANPGVNDYVHLGCYAEGNTGRALTYDAGVPGGDMTVAKCTAACRAANYILAGVEYGGECCRWHQKELVSSNPADLCSLRQYYCQRRRTCHQRVQHGLQW